MCRSKGLPLLLKVDIVDADQTTDEVIGEVRDPNGLWLDEVGIGPAIGQHLLLYDLEGDPILLRCRVGNRGLTAIHADRKSVEIDEDLLTDGVGPGDRILVDAHGDAACLVLDVDLLVDIPGDVVGGYGRPEDVLVLDLLGGAVGDAGVLFLELSDGDVWRQTLHLGLREEWCVVL